MYLRDYCYLIMLEQPLEADGQEVPGESWGKIWSLCSRDEFPLMKLNLFQIKEGAGKKKKKRSVFYFELQKKRRNNSLLRLILIILRYDDR